MERMIKEVEQQLPVQSLGTRVAAYARVSSGKDAMLHSLSAQVSYYSQYIQSHPGWIYCGVYSDEAFTGTKEDRKGFQKLLKECRAGRIDLVISKSISRFARNTITLLETVRELKLLGVDVYFEEQSIHTLSADGELMLTKCGSVVPKGETLCWKCSTSAKKPKKKWVAVGIVAAVLVCIIAIIIPLVLRNAPVSESQIKDDMRSAMSQYLDDSFSLDGITITKRQTDTSDKTDTVYLEWTAHNSVCSVENEAVMTYQLYNDGWMFEDINSHRTTTTITASDVSPESARAEAESSYIPQKYEGGDWVEVARETDLASGEDVFVYNYKIYFYYCTRTYTARVKYKFYNTGWSYDSVEWDDGVSDWDIDGEWTCRTKDAQVWIKIHSFEDRQGTLEYSVKFDYQGWYYYGVQSFYTDEPVSVYGSEHTDTDRIEYLQIDLPDRNASSEHAEAGYLKLYPSAMYWNSVHAKDNVYKLEPSDGSSSVKLSELFMTEDERYSHWSLEYTDPNGDTYDEYYEYSSYDSMWDSNFEGYTFYELDKPYSTITGTYFCSPKMPNDVGISFYIYADDVCIYKDEHLHVGDGVHNFNVDISGKSTLKIMVVCDDEDYYCGTDDPRPTIILVDTYLN